MKSDPLSVTGVVYNFHHRCVEVCLLTDRHRPDHRFTGSGRSGLEPLELEFLLKILWWTGGS